MRMLLHDLTPARPINPAQFLRLRTWYYPHSAFLTVEPRTCSISTDWDSCRTACCESQGLSAYLHTNGSPCYQNLKRRRKKPNFNSARRKLKTRNFVNSSCRATKTWTNGLSNYSCSNAASACSLKPRLPPAIGMHSKPKRFKTSTWPNVSKRPISLFKSQKNKKRLSNVVYRIRRIGKTILINQVDLNGEPSMTQQDQGVGKHHPYGHFRQG